ncbi:hypothetical protein FOL47_009398 [Perkinsus chesapeaki]|uniref:PDEase domain-containing protein n=1 Tax=Perkinsus chesapeaki TaxID=330153 RepID=A0A7J6L8V9_PERCH|nr:hypothetical protein FOL47_009398 [Perkinsus chesapeaki]
MAAFVEFSVESCTLVIMLWLWMIFSDEGHLRVPTLANHILQNNDFTKAIFYENYLPPHQRLKWVATPGLQGEKSTLRPRRACREACEETHYPFGSICKDLEDTSSITITRHGNQYDRLLRFPAPPGSCSLDPDSCPGYEDYLACRELANSPPFSKTIPTSGATARKQRHDICFNACRSTNDTEEAGFTGIDTRPLCTPDSEISDILCVPPDDGYESQLIFYGGYTCFSGDSDGSRADRGCTSWTLLWIGIIIINAIQAVTEIILLHVGGLSEDVRAFIDARDKCLGHTALTVYLAATIVLLFQPLSIAEFTGRELDVLATVFLTLLMDQASTTQLLVDRDKLLQAKNLLVQPLIWWVLIRRCGTIFPGIQEYNEEYLLQWDLQDSLVPKRYLSGLRSGISQFATQDYWEGVAFIENIYKWTDFATVCIFMTEITFKTFAYWLDFWLDPWNLVDNVVVIASFVVAVMAAEMKGLGLLRLLKLLRIMVVIRKVSEGRKKLKELKTKSSVTVGSYVDKVLELIEELQSAKYIPPHLKDDLDWVKDVIVSNKLYEVSIDADVTEANSDGVANNEEMSAWITAANAAPVKPKDETKEDLPAFGGRIQTDVKKVRESRAYRESQARRESRRQVTEGASKFALLFSALICHMRHPGLTNDFLIKARTPEATRYNDISVLQHCHLAHAFGILEDPELNFLLNVDPEISSQFRKLVVKAILRLDISRHMTEVTSLTSAMAADTFPSREEDVLLLLSVSLRVADLSWACRPQQIYCRWAEKFLEELFLQGDLEKVMGSPVSPFCDRDAVQSARVELAFSYVIVSPLINAYTVLYDGLYAPWVVEGLEPNKQALNEKVGLIA